MKILNGIFFFGYVLALVVFGGLCMFTAQIDQRLLFGLHTDGLAPQTAASLLSQYRFSRAIECGFGVFALIFRQEIYRERLYNRLFLGTMFMGVAARVVSLCLDGRPAPIFYGFLVFELIGVAVIFVYSRSTLNKATA